MRDLYLSPIIDNSPKEIKLKEGLVMDMESTGSIQNKDFEKYLSMDKNCLNEYLINQRVRGASCSLFR